MAIIPTNRTILVNQNGLSYVKVMEAIANTLIYANTLFTEVSALSNTVNVLYGDVLDLEQDMLTNIELARQYALNPEDESFANGAFSSLHYSKKSEEYANSSNTSSILSRAWAEGTEPGGENTKSAKEWAELVSDNAFFYISDDVNSITVHIGQNVLVSENTVPYSIGDNTFEIETLTINIP